MYGYSSTGVGVRATSPTGTALLVSGKARFSRSGRIAVVAGKASVAKSLAGVIAGSIVLAVLQTNESGVWVRAAVPAAGKFTVIFNRTLATSAVVGYMVLN